MNKIKMTDYEAVRRLTIDYAKRSGNPAAMDAALDASYLHEYLNAVLNINPYLWLGEVRRYLNTSDWQTLIRYAVSLHLADDAAASSLIPSEELTVNDPDAPAPSAARRRSTGKHCIDGLWY